MTDRKIIVGIDFGTTFSGIAWAEAKPGAQPTTIVSWPISKDIREGESSEKVPTKLHFVGDDEVQWGFSIPPNTPRNKVIERFKLELDPNHMSLAKENYNDNAARGGRDVDTLVTTFFTALMSHLVYILREKLGKNLVKSTPLEFVVTVPAIWSDLAKDKTRQACVRALNITDGNAKSPIHLVSEPEAAAIFALKGLGSHDLKIGDNFVICDAGGGTVDLITYTITGLTPILEVKEAAPGSGAACGSAILNLKFAEFLKLELGRKKGFDDELVAECLERFEKGVKRTLMKDTPPTEQFTIPVGGLADSKKSGIVRGRWQLEARHLHTIFRPVIQEVIQLVKDQIKASGGHVRTVLLVGGFGASSYLKASLKSALGDGVEVLQPPHAWQAVVQGAVMKGLALCNPAQLTQVKLENRKARRHYGVEMNVRYKSSRHASRSDLRFWDAKDGCFKIPTMKWFIRRGDDVTENEPFLTSFNMGSFVSLGSPRLPLVIYVDQNVKPRDAPLFRDTSVGILCRVLTDLSHVPKDELAVEKGRDGLEYYQIPFSVEAVYRSASTQYTLIHNEKRYNSVTAEYV